MKTTFKYLSRLSVLIFSAMFLLSSCSKENTFSNRKISFNADWSFHLNDSLTNKDTIGTSTKWRTLDLPHDWSIEGKFDEKSPAGYGGGSLNGGLGWYKKTFKISKEDINKKISITFDGVYKNSEVWINGHYLGKRPNGYIGFQYELSPYLNYGEKTNEIIVKVDNSKQPNSRWYSGSGIFRNVWLETTDKLHVEHWGTYVTTPKVTAEKALVNIETRIQNDHLESKKLTLVTTIYKEDKKVTSGSTTYITLTPKSGTLLNVKAEVESPVLWSVEKPELYTAVTEILVDDKIVDQYKTNFGIRDFKFDLNKGFILNGKQVKIKGVCMHHDLGPLGSAINTRAIERQLEILKEMGVNGIRTSHNPPAPELLDVCDKMGFIVMDEAFDMWKQNKTKYDYANDWDKWHRQDLADQLRRDRNHPSIFIWSIGNEIPEQWNETGVEIAKELAEIVRINDKTRPLTAAMNPPVNMNIDAVTLQFEKKNVQFNAIAKSGILDLIGYNYAHQTYEYHQKNFPNTPFIATETTSGLETRGYYDAVSDTIKKWPVRWDLKFTEGNPGNTVSAYDQVQAPWGSTHEATWKVIKKHDFLSGMYIWTGFDYIGEPTPYEWPSVSSYFGIVDLAGFPKDVYYMYQSEWTNKTVLYVFPHWNWKAGQTVDVWAYYNNADEVELFVNGKSVGKRSKKGDDLHVMWRIPFQAGTLKAISRKNGKTVLEKEIKTAGNPSQLKLTADRSTIKADKNDLSFVTVDILDEKETLVPNANNEINFSLTGNGKIVGVCSGDPVSHESYKGNKHTALAGKCLVIVQSGDKTGRVELTAKAKGLKPATIVITTE
ncbi:glycoside hydrolase family 2 [Flavobacterium sp. WLB]|uniref:glycoside hydrolase family 2 TIM barrel-domain containing protein n=1 Tax=unclassified Flavobacterium TaxID=196869 RepID=UPI0006AB98A7|nr:MULTISPECIES: glycoside hydrolase family 2 TIM barrel-domain containing protein [unclassified Flavobacterium]KOP36905.1 glycoside hydrolase [Flavobacterium sp. VMW]OWU89012.1 glycoside hydrolase [Flavobacterium sp. NLM]PUU70813.1 glycoside hydrolase family 2 [Flavobacterium sp. WLB]